MNDKTSPSINLSVSNLRAEYESGNLTPDSLIDDLLKKCESYTDYNIWISLLSKEQIKPYLDALKDKPMEESPLWGVPFAIKDNIDLKGIPTTAGHPDFAYIPEQHSFVVEQLINAGAIPLGKTNLDQFATGLVGTRSPYGACKNSFDPTMVSGGSSAGSSVSTALGLVTFALGTDTAGSGRVPAAYNNLMGVKPTRGLLSNRGAVPACLALDCITIFALNPDDAETILSVAAEPDVADAYSREAAFAKGLAGASYKVGVPAKEQLEFFGHPEYAGLFEKACAQLIAAGAELVTVDIEPMIEAAKLLYQGPWVAERYHAAGEFIEKQLDNPATNDTVAKIILGGKDYSAVSAFDATYKLQAFKKQSDAILANVDAIVVPTTTNHYSIDELNENPIELNSRVGYYTNFMNLLDYSALAVPAGFTTEALPFGITLFADAFADQRLLDISKKYLAIRSWGMGATGLPMQLSETPEENLGYIHVAVCGAHLDGMPLNTQLQERNAKLMESTTTSENYKFYALAGGPPYRPGLERVKSGGEKIYVEVWAVPEERFGSFVAGIPAPLGIGKLELDDGRWVPGFVCEDYGFEGARNITEFKDWRVYLQFK